MSENQLPKLKKRKLTTLQESQHKFSFGQKGEKRACDFLIASGFSIIDTNVRFKKDELDIVAFDHKHHELVFVEVKSRQSAELGHPSLAVGRKKIASMKRVAAAFLRSNPEYTDYRFDVITITTEIVEHFENITWARW